MHALTATPISMVGDRPFLFVIHDVELGTPLFLGRVADPRPDGTGVSSTHVSQT